MKLRPYQEDAIQRVREKMMAGLRRVLLVIATGGGKTFTSAKIILNVVARGKRVIFLAHRKELIEQCSKTLTILGVDHGVIKSGHPKMDLRKPVQVASIQTLIKRKHWPADLVVIDEAHRSMAATYQELAERYEDDNAALLGLTATPYRLDGKPLGDMYNAMVEVISTQELIDDGYLINPTVFGSRDPLDLSRVDVGSRGDYNRTQLGNAMASTILHGELMTNWARICGGALGSETVWYKDSEGRDRVSETDCDACTVIFSPNVKKSLEIVEQFQAAGVRAAHVDGKTKPSERKRILEALESGELSVVSNVDILCEGWDLPRLECIIGARPTRSKALYKQMGGRLMRPDDEKRIAFLLDHANWTRTHGFLYEPTKHSLEKPEKRPRKGTAGAPLKECPQCQSLHFIGATLCPECGYIWPKKELEITEEELVELDGKMVNRADVVPRTERQEAFDKLATQCVNQGYKPNWARVRYRNAYGEWPSAQGGIMTPRFFRQYERDFKKRLEQQALAQAAADAVASG